MIRGEAAKRLSAGESITAELAPAQAGPGALLFENPKGGSIIQPGVAIGYPG